MLHELEIIVLGARNEACMCLLPTKILGIYRATAISHAWLCCVQDSAGITCRAWVMPCASLRCRFLVAYLMITTEVNQCTCDACNSAPCSMEHMYKAVTGTVVHMRDDNTADPAAESSAKQQVRAHHGHSLGWLASV